MPEKVCQRILLSFHTKHGICLIAQKQGGVCITMFPVIARVSRSRERSVVDGDGAISCDYTELEIAPSAIISGLAMTITSKM